MNKILFVILLTAVSVFAKDSYTLLVNNSMEVESYFTILNFIASLFQSNDYFSLLKLVVLLGSFITYVTVVTTSYAGDSTGGIKKFAAYMIFITGMLTIMGGSTQVIVKTDNLSSVYYTNMNGENGVVSTFPDSATGVVVANVPESLAFILKGFNTFGNEINRLFSMGLSPVNGYDIKSYGKDLRDSMKILGTSLSVLDPAGAAQIEALMKDCIIAPASLGGYDGMTILDTMSRTNDIFKTMNGIFSANTLLLYEMKPGGQQFTTVIPDLKITDKYLKYFLVTFNGNTYQCGQFFTGIAQNVIPKARAMVSPNLKGIGPGAMELLTGELNVPKSNFEETAIQAGLLSLYGDSKSSLSQEGVPYAMGKSKAEFIMSNLGMGYQMSENLPYYKSFITMIMVCAFPLLFALMLLPHGWSIIKNYLKVFLWVEMWNPLSTILNLFINMHAETKVAGTLSQTSALGMFSDLSMTAALAGYLYVSIPIIAWGLIEGGGSAFASIGSGLAAKMQHNMTSDSMSKDTQKITKQREDSMRRGEVISMASQDQEAARNSAYSEVGGLLGAREIGSEGLINSSNFNLQAPARSAQEKIAARGGVSQAASTQGVIDGYNFKTGAAETDYLGKDLNKAANATGITTGISKNTNVNTLQTFGDKELQQNSNNMSIDSNQKSITRFNEIGKTGNSVQNYADLSAKVDFNTRENPTNFASDLNGDKKVSGAELKEAGKVADNQSKIGFLQTKETQNQLEMSGQDYLDSNNSRVAGAAGRGASTVLGNMGAAVTGGAGAKGVTNTYSDIKDAKNVQNLESNNIGAETVANVESKDTMKKVVGAATETDTLSNVIPGIAGQYEEVRGEAVAKLKEQGYSDSEANRLADRALIGKLTKHNMAVGDLTERALENDLKAVDAKREKAMNGIVSEAIGKDMGAYKNYEHNLNRYNQAMKNGDMNQAFALKAQLDKADSGKMSEIKERVNTALNSEKAKNVAASFAEQKNEVFNEYKQSGLIDIQNGQVKYLDTAKMLNSGSLNDEQRMYMTNKIKAGLDGLRTDMVGLNGMENKFVQDINGNNVTDISKAEISYVKTGNFEHGIMYEAGKSDLVKNSIGKDGLAIASTAVNYVGKAAAVTGASNMIREKVAETVKGGVTSALKKEIKTSSPTNIVNKTNVETTFADGAGI